MPDILKPILITGAARSGTSLTAGVIALCGAWGGKITGPTPFNKKGQFENVEIRDRVTKPFLAAIGADRLGQHPLPDTDNLNSVTDWDKRIFSIIRNQGYATGLWYYKGAKLCLYWPVWHGGFPEAKWIIVRRNADEIAASCMRTSFMRAFDTHQGWLNWVREHEDRFASMERRGLNCFEIWPKRAIEGDLSEYKKMISWCGLEWNEEVMNFITPELWNAA